MGFSSLLDWEGTCYQWRNCLFRDQLQDMFYVLYGSVQHTTTNHAHTFEPPRLRIDGGLFATQISDQDNSAIWRSCLNTGLERCADQFDHKIDSTFILQDLAQILLAIIDHLVGSQFAQRFRTLSATCRCSDPGPCMSGKLDGKRAYTTGTGPD